MRDSYVGNLALCLWSFLAFAWPLTGFSAAVEEDGAATVPDGKTIYRVSCLPCHGTVERSNAPFFPQLEQRARNRSPDEFVAAVLEGRTRDRAAPPGLLNSHEHGGMPAFDYLANEEIAALVSYLYRRLGDQPVEVTAEQVARARGEGQVSGPGPALRPEDAARAEALYLSHCAGCHGVDRSGLSGRAIDGAALKDRSPAEIMAVLHYGSVWGMPSWGTSEQLSARDMSLLVRYLKQDGSQPPGFSLQQARSSWTRIQPPSSDGAHGKFEVPVDQLFVSLLHDSGQVALIDGRNYRIHSLVDTHLAPQDLALTPDGRFLAVLARSGHLALVDLRLDSPAVIARSRVSYSARRMVITGTASRPLLIVGGQGNRVLAIVDGRTLEPLGQLSLKVDPAGMKGGGVLDLLSVPGSSRVLALLSGESAVVALDLSVRGSRIETRTQATPLTLTPESFALDPSGQYLLVVGNDAALALLDLERRAQIASLTLDRWPGGGYAIALTDSPGGASWAISTPAAARILEVRAQLSEASPPRLELLRSIELPHAGSLYLAAHRASPFLWTDLTLNGIPGAASRVARVDLRAAAEGAVTTLRLQDHLGARFSNLSAIYPQFDAKGRRVWFTLWNRQDRPSAIAVVNAESRAIEAMITDDRLTTPIRTFSAAGLLQQSLRAVAE